jgi:hypothetical protein
MCDISFTRTNNTYTLARYEFEVKKNDGSAVGGLRGEENKFSA